MNKTKIEWVKNPDGTQGYTWNPITGCLNGCDYCYARKLANGRLRSRYLANDNIANPMRTGSRDDIEEESMEILSDPFYPRFWPERLEEMRHSPYRRRFMPMGIFTCDMSDLFGIGIPEEWTKKILDVIRAASWDRFYLLTKQPQNLIKWSPFPENCYVGVTATNYESFYFGAIKYLGKVKAKVKYISFEPLLEGLGTHIPGWLSACLIDAGISWVILGSQTKPYRPPAIEAVKEIVEACDKAGIPVFLKENLKPLVIDNLGHTYPSFAYGEHLRQELPDGVPEKI